MDTFHSHHSLETVRWLLQNAPLEHFVYLANFDSKQEPSSLQIQNPTLNFLSLGDLNKKTFLDYVTVSEVCV